MFEVRTDLAVEENERITKAQEEAKGITVTEADYDGEWGKADGKTERNLYYIRSGGNDRG